MATLLAIIYSVLESFNIKAYLYQYTIHKFAVSHGMNAERESKLYPPKYRYYAIMGKINWIVIAVLAFYSWQTALILFGLFWVLSIILPCNHIQHFKELRDHIFKTIGLRIEFMYEYYEILDIIREHEEKR